jgi:hypothetical protein
MANDELARLKTNLNRVDNEVKVKMNLEGEIYDCLLVDFRSSSTKRTSR